MRIVKLFLLLSIIFTLNITHAAQTVSYVSLRLPSTVVGPGSRNTFEARRIYALKVEKILRNDGIKDEKVITAMLVNMWHESSWNPNAKSGSCVGLFQLHTKYAGRGMTLTELKDINDHMYRLLSLDCYKKWKKWALASSNKTTCGYIAFRFASDVERCAVQHRRPREVTANKWWGVFSKLPKQIKSA
jgi:hypothetical protein